MRAFVILASIVVSSWLVSGCASSTKGDTGDASTYKCPDCKETVSWSYEKSSLKPTIRKKVKTVSHECPMCKKEWGANLAVESQCARCQEAHLECPICKKHG